MFGKKGSKILKLPSVRNCFTLAMKNKLVVTINSLKVPKIKKLLLCEMKFLVPNYSCLQNWLGGYCPQISSLSGLNWICWTPPRTKFLGTPLPVAQLRAFLRTVQFLKKPVIWNFLTQLSVTWCSLIRWLQIRQDTWQYPSPVVTISDVLYPITRISHQNLNWCLVQLCFCRLLIYGFYFW